MTFQYIQNKRKLKPLHTHINKFLVDLESESIVYIKDKEVVLIPGEIIYLDANDLAKDWARFAIQKGYLRAISP